MFFPERVISIKATDRVLEVGPGALPHPRSDVFLDKRFPSEEAACAQRGLEPKLEDDRGTVYYEGGRFPFRDQAFDYVVCSHVLEHVPEQDLGLFVSELQRIASRGYIEFPAIFYELINFCDAHRWMMNYRRGRICLMSRDRFKSNYVHKAFRELFYGADSYMYKAFRRYKEFFFCGFEWNGAIPYEIVEDYDKLIDSEDYRRVREYFQGFQPPARKRSFAVRAARARGRLQGGLARIWRHLSGGQANQNERTARSWQACDGDATLRLDYDLPPQSVVLDVGGYRGDWARQIVERYDPRVYILEAVPEFAADIAAKFSANPKVKVCAFGLLDRDAELPISMSKDGTSLFREKGGTTLVRTRDVAAFFAENGLESVDLIKINIEGAEYPLLRRMIETGIAARCRDIQVQFHRFVPDAARIREELRNELAKTHALTYDFPFVWENWRRK